MLVGEVLQRIDPLRWDFRDELSVAAVPLAVTLLRQCNRAEIHHACLPATGASGQSRP